MPETKFIIRQNILKKEDKEEIKGFTLLRSENDSTPEPCICPIQIKHEYTYNEGISTDIKKSILFKGFSSGLINQLKTEKTTVQKHCSSQCVAFQLMEKNKSLHFKCNWATFSYPIDSIMKNQQPE